MSGDCLRLNSPDQLSAVLRDIHVYTYITFIYKYNVKSHNNATLHTTDPVSCVTDNVYAYILLLPPPLFV